MQDRLEFLKCAIACSSLSKDNFDRKSFTTRFLNRMQARELICDGEVLNDSYKQKRLSSVRIYKVTIKNSGEYHHGKCFVIMLLHHSLNYQWPYSSIIFNYGFFRFHFIHNNGRQRCYCSIAENNFIIRKFKNLTDEG